MEQVFQLAAVASMMYATGFVVSRVIELADNNNASKKAQLLEADRIINRAEQLIREQGLRARNLTAEQRRAFAEQAERMLQEEDKRKQP